MSVFFFIDEMMINVSIGKIKYRYELSVACEIP